MYIFRSVFGCSRSKQNPKIMTRKIPRRKNEQGQDDRWVFRMADDFCFSDLYTRLVDKYEEQLEITYQDEDEEW